MLSFSFQVKLINIGGVISIRVSFFTENSSRQQLQRLDVKPAERCEIFHF